MKSRAVKSRTADLFGAADAIRPAASAVSPSSAANRGAPIPQPVIRPRSIQLWYAVVFPELSWAAQSQASLQRLCMVARQFTSWVSIESPNALLLEIKGSVKLFGSLERLHSDLDAAWSRLALRTLSATAPSTLGALWCARAGKQLLLEDPGLLAGHLAGLPIACTSWDAARLQTLRAMGVTCVGELLRLPRAGVARRLSPAALLDLDVALARQAAPRKVFVPRERFRERCDFEMEIGNVAYLEKALEPLVGRCAQFLRERQAGVQALELRLRHRTDSATRVRLGLVGITGERRRLQEVLAHKLHRLELAAPVRGMELRSGFLQPLSPGSLDVFAGSRAGGGRDTAPQLVERLRARLGEAAVYGVCPIPEHRPEAAWQRVEELQLTGPASGDQGMTHQGITGQGMTHQGMTRQGMTDREMPRPVWLLDEPCMLATSQARQLQPAALLLEQGPERIESGWWDGKGIARDYYIARHTRGARLWVFQERQSKCWYVHGVFA